MPRPGALRSEAQAARRVPHGSVLGGRVAAVPIMRGLRRPVPPLAAQRSAPRPACAARAWRSRTTSSPRSRVTQPARRNSVSRRLVVSRESPTIRARSTCVSRKRRRRAPPGPASSPNSAASSSSRLASRCAGREVHPGVRTVSLRWPALSRSPRRSRCPIPSLHSPSLEEAHRPRRRRCPSLLAYSVA